MKAPIFKFKNLDSTGLDRVPVNCLIVVEDSEDKPSQFLLKDKTGIDSTTRVRDIIDDSNLVVNTTGAKIDDSTVSSENVWSAQKVSDLLNLKANEADVYKKNEIDNLLDEKEDISNKNVANGYAGLDENGEIPLDKLPKEVKNTFLFEKKLFGGV